MSIIPSSIHGLILDMDGVLWSDVTPIGNLPDIFSRIKEMGLVVAMATNNSTQTIDQYVDRLRAFGVGVDPWQIVTSSLAVTDLMSRQLPEGTPVFAIGESGLVEALKTALFEVMPLEYAQRAEAVVVGLDRGITFEKMVEATLLIQAGKPFYATNPDRTFPTPRGQIPGTGAWLAVIETATGIHPIYAGKPYPYMLELAMKRLETTRDNTLVIGDRLETDIAGGQAVGCQTALVLTGISTLSQAQSWTPGVNIIANSLSDLLESER